MNQCQTGGECNVHEQPQLWHQLHINYDISTMTYRHMTNSHRTEKTSLWSNNPNWETPALGTNHTQLKAFLELQRQICNTSSFTIIIHGFGEDIRRTWIRKMHKKLIDRARNLRVSHYCR